NVESKKMQKSLLKQKFKEFKISKEEGLDKGYDKMEKILTQMNTLKIKPKPEDVNMKFLRGLPPSWSGNDGYTTTLSDSPSSSSSNGSSKSKCSGVDDVIYSFFVNHEIDQHLVYEDLDQMNKEEFEEYDLKHQMAMLSIKVHRFEKKHGRKIKFNGRENARFDKKLVKCFNCKQIGKDGSDSKSMVVVDGSIDWDKQTEEGNTETRSLENFGMIAGIKIESDADSEGDVVSVNDAIPTGVSVSASNVAATVVSPQSEIEFSLMGLSTEAKWNNSGKNLYKLIDSSMFVKTKRGLGHDKYIGEGKLGIDDSKFSIFHTNSDELEGKPIYNRFASVDHMKAVPLPLIGNYMPPSNIPNIDESQMVYGKKATDSSKIKTNDDSISHSNDYVLFDFSDRSSELSTNDLQSCDFSVECSRPNHSDHDSTDSISSVSAPVSESRDTIVNDCDRQEDFPSVCSIETDVKSSKTLCNRFGSFNKESHFRKHKSVASKSCYVCGSYLHLIKDCDLHERRLAKRNAEGKGILGRRTTGKPVDPNRPKPVSAGQQNPVFAGPPNLVSAKQQNTISARQPNPVSAGQPNTVSAGDATLACNSIPLFVFASDGILGPRPLNIQPKMDQNSRAGLMLKDNSLRLEKEKDTGIVDSGCSRSMSGNKDKLEYFEDFDGGEVTFKGSTGKISRKGTIKTKNLNFENVLYVKELQHFNLISVSQILYLKPFGCHVAILNTSDPLGKFDKKSDEGYIVGYSISSKAYKVYNLVSRKIKETMNLKFLENKPFVAGTGHAWMFDIDYLTDSLNYSRIISTNLTAGSQGATPSNTGSQEDDLDLDDEPDVFIIQSTPVIPIVDEATNQNDGTKEADRLGLAFPSLNLILGVGSASIGSFISTGSTPPVSAGSAPPMSPCASPIFADRHSISAGKSHVSADIHDGLKIFDCPKFGIFTSSSYDEEFSGPDANNLESSLDVSSTITKRIHNIHPTSQVLGDIKSSV
nr:ribonuclease H-like domain-containing protein [Tanacetum cinerariifolium]